MKTALYNSKYFIGIGVLILLFSSGIGFFMTNKFNKRTERISSDMAISIYQLKANVINSEFRSFIRGLNNSEAIIPQFNSSNEFLQTEKLINTLLLSHPKINHGWYAIAKGKDTVYKKITKIGTAYQHGSIADYQKKWIHSQLITKDSITRIGTVINVKDSMHGLFASRHRLADSSTVILGLDINFKDLQRYLWSVDSTSRASMHIVDEHGYYIISPEEKLIGKRIFREAEGTGLRKLSDSISSYETTKSAYLEIPVYRFYTPLNIGLMKWTMVVETPVFVTDEEVKAIEKYVMIMFIVTTLIILILLEWSHAKWQKQFMLRQLAEVSVARQEKENAVLQLDKLKEKLDPHFLFNSLSSLNGLIQEQPELAKAFVVKLSRVYRYVLDPTPNGLEEVSREVRFASEYFFLLKIRFGDALASLEIDLNEKHSSAYIPFMSVQTLVENAIKHNVVSKLKPLHISIRSEGDGLLVTNNLQLRTDVKDSGKQGLKYLQSIYAHFGDLHLTYGIEDGSYKCFLPLIKKPPTP
ncbi:sensor histidine kinase YesM [Pedobacter cryoconitis]|uniref:sensor histidine kinase n=1 Tax=Pedobacter cryoconitis TaxID=188932 RepID=UPI001620C092|nr:histidine kinase [Pedobacter cryoconitis]MBB6274238.1 sensor histidine kinase YesM [Pedobacter cryoconitis]